MLLEYTGLAAGIAILITLALRGANVVFAAVISSLVVALTNGLNLFDALTTDFSAGPVGGFTFAGRFFLLFVTGAIFGRAMAESHAAYSIAQALARALGAHRALWIVVLACSLLTYGGVVVFVVLFSVYPLGVRLIEQAGIPRRLLVAAIGLGAASFTMTALPGTPSIQNVIPATVLGTDLYAGAGLGLVGGGLMFAMGMWYLERERKRAGTVAPESRTTAASTVDPEPGSMPHWGTALLPIVIVLGMILLPRLLGALGATTDGSFAAQLAGIGRSQPIAWPSFALIAGTVACWALFPALRVEPMATFGRGTNDALLPLVNTAAVIGFGSVVAKTTGFAHFAQLVLSIPLPPLFSLFVSVNLLAGVVGSSSGGLQLFMTTLAPHFVDIGLSPAVIHRIAAMASGGLDSLPHSGTVVAMLVYTGMTHREAYKDLGVITVVIPLIATFLTICLALAVT
jgi:H+/gluconate symporter-like permease